jgi:hypothetical protein
MSKNSASVQYTHKEKIPHPNRFSTSDSKLLLISGLFGGVSVYGYGNCWNGWGYYPCGRR